MTQRINFILLTVAMTLLQPLSAHAHFLWLVSNDTSKEHQLHVYFGEAAEADDPDLLERVAGVHVWRQNAKGKTQDIPVAKGSDSLVGNLNADASSDMFGLSHDLGVMTRGGETFLLRYYAKTGPALGDLAWERVDCTKRLDLDLVPQRRGDKIRITVKWHGKPLSGAQLKVLGPGIDDFESKTDASGTAEFAIGKDGLYSIRARHIQNQGGRSNGKDYKTTRHYSTLALKVSANGAIVVDDAYPPIPQMVTSFGAAIEADVLYVYGGHTGGAHSYSNEAQANTLRCLDLKRPKAWNSLGNGPRLQGLALVAHRGKLYRIGGFTAKNHEGEEHDLWSQDSVASYDVAAGRWAELSPLPEPRSSFDAAVLADKIYVVGGWQMAGQADKIWHKTAHVLDLTADVPKWSRIAQPPFARRALSVAAHDGKIYAVGGMQQEGGPSQRTDIYDPATDTWSRGPDLQGEPMDGFGSSSFAIGGRLFATTYSGKLQQLASDGSSWSVVTDLDRARFFHRMLPLSDSKLLSLGGASMSEGKFQELDVIEVESTSSRE